VTSTGADPGGALGRELERLTRRIATIETRTNELAGLLEQLATDVTTLLTHAETDEREAVRAWLLTEDPDQALADLLDLATWLGRVWLRYPDAILPSCWLWHPALIEELRWVRCAHRDAYHPHHGTWQKAGDWHDRLRPGAARRLRTAYGTCELREHTQPRPAPTVPLTDAIEATAHTWTTTPEHPLTPTELQIRRAEQHDDTHHHTR
jgi:hypothetical protein